MHTGSRSSCKSSWGAFDMVGNVDEWVADWADITPASPCANTSTLWGLPGTGDLLCYGGDGSTHSPGALLRGRSWSDEMSAGVFWTNNTSDPSGSGGNAIGFQCGR